MFSCLGNYKCNDIFHSRELERIYKIGENVYLKITAHIDLSVTHAINWHQRDILKHDRFRQTVFWGM